MAKMIPNMAVLPLAKSTARAQIEKVQSTLRDERRNDNTRHSGSTQALGLCPVPHSSHMSCSMALGQISGSEPSAHEHPVCMGLLFAVGHKFQALSHFLNCDGLPQGLAFALQFHVLRECLRCERHERRCP